MTGCDFGMHGGDCDLVDGPPAKHHSPAAERQAPPRARPSRPSTVAVGRLLTMSEDAEVEEKAARMKSIMSKLTAETRYIPRRPDIMATKPPFPATWMTTAKIEELRAEEMADDIEFEHDLATLCLSSEDEVRNYFADGGELVGEKEHSIRTWLKKNVANAAHRKKLDEGLCGRFQSLSELYAFLASHASKGVEAAMAELLGSIDVPPMEQKYYEKWVTPLWELANRVPPDLASHREAARVAPEHARKHFAKWLQARLPPVGWGAGLSWEVQCGLYVPRKPTAVLRVFCLGGISESSMAFGRWVTSAPAWLGC